MLSTPSTAALLALVVATGATPAINAADGFISALKYVPKPALCPTSGLVRPATSLNTQEAAYVKSRTPKANAALASWLKKQGVSCTSPLPSVGLASSGGGLRALLETAGVVKALDGRDSNLGTSGLYQGLTYQSGLSGGSWFLSSLAANNWPTVSSLEKQLWEPAFSASLLLPAYLLSEAGAEEYAVIAEDLVAKQDAGYQTSIIDAWGRLLSYSLLYGSDGGVADRLSGISSLSNFTDSAIPFPIMTSIGNQPSEGQCAPTLNSTMYEFTTYEYGSWDKGVSAFANSKYMGSSLTNGKPTHSFRCTSGYDNIGYVLGTSSDVFDAACPNAVPPDNSTSDLPGVLEELVSLAHSPLLDDLFGLYPNPFYKYPRSTTVSNERLLTLSDGGGSDQNVPIWPFIAGSRQLDVLIANDNSADTTDNFPNGTEIHQTYLNAQADGHTRMPYIPPVSTFTDEGLNKRATFFGCNETDTMFIVYLPNVNYTFPSNQPTLKLQYSVKQTQAMIHNGVEIATQNGDKQWPFCLACAVMNKAEDLPAGCNACFDKYCYRKN